MPEMEPCHNCGEPGRTRRGALRKGQLSWCSTKCSYEWRNERHYIPVGASKPVVESLNTRPVRCADGRIRTGRHSVEVDKHTWNLISVLAEENDCSRPGAVNKAVRQSLGEEVRDWPRGDTG